MTHRRASAALLAIACTLTGCESPPPGEAPRPAWSAPRPGHATPTYSISRELRVGDPAPILAGVRWLKGEPVRYWKPGRVYVLDFWATWCAPCIAGFPHMNDLQRRYASRGVTVIGVAVLPNPRSTPPEEFVASRGAEIGFTIAQDVDNHAHRAFLGAAGIAGIPTVMIIDTRGRLAWTGSGALMPGLDDAVERALRDDPAPTR